MRRLIAFVWMAASLLAFPAARADFIISSTERFVSTDVPGGTPAHITNSSGLFSETATDVDSSANGLTHQTAHQSSHIPISGSFLVGSGTIGTTAQWFSDQASFSIGAQSSFFLNFSVTTPGQYAFVAAVNWNAINTMVGQGAGVLLENTSSGVVQAEVFRDVSMPGAATVSATVSLVPGQVYTLLANARIDTGGGAPTSYIGNARWDFSLFQVPEPSAFAVTASALVGISRLRRRNRPLSAPA